MMFDYDTVRRIQREKDAGMKSAAVVANDPRLFSAATALQLGESVKALAILNPFIEELKNGAVGNDATTAGKGAEAEKEDLSAGKGAEAENDDSETGSSAQVATRKMTLAAARRIRAETFLRVTNWKSAKMDAEASILLDPFCSSSFETLATAELELGQCGRAEVAFRLGLHVDPENENIKKSLKRLRAEDKVVADVRGMDGSDKKIRKKQNEAGMLLHPLDLPEVLRDVILGNLAGLKKIWKPEMRKLRHGSVKSAIIHYPAFGCHRMKLSGEDYDTRLRKYKAVVDFLFDQGVRLDAKDEVGYTAVMHMAGTEPAPQLLEYYLKKGADPNVRSVYGSVALFDAIGVQNKTEVDILLRFEADAYIKDNDGMAPLQFASRFREVAAIFDRHLRTAVPQRECAGCGGRDTLSRCKRCRVVFYCEQKCQRNHWTKHRESCNRWRRSHKRLRILRPEKGEIESLIPDAMVEIHNRLFKPGHKRQTLETKWLFDAYVEERGKGNFTLKVQVPHQFQATSCSPKPDIPFLVYNKTRSFICKLSPIGKDADDVRSVILTEGVGGMKAYFWAFMEENNKDEVVLITDPVLPVYSW